MDKTLLQMVDIVDADPAVDTVNGFTGRRRRHHHEHGAHVHLAEAAGANAKSTPTRSSQRLRPKLAQGARRHALSAGLAGRARRRHVSSNAQYQFTMRGDNLEDLTNYAPQMLDELKTIRIIADVNSDQQNRGLQSMVNYDRDDRRALRHLAATDRQHPLRRLRPAPGLHHVHVAEPVSRGDGSGAAILAESQSLHQVYVTAPSWHGRFRSSAIATTPRHRAAGGEPSGPVPRGHDFVQPAARRGAGRCGERDQRGGAARSACPPPFRPDSPAPRRPIRIRSAASRC